MFSKLYIIYFKAILSSIFKVINFNNKQFTVSPTGSEWLKDYVSVNFSIDTAISSYVWSMLGTLEWLSQVLRSLIQLIVHLLYSI